jgi:general stress protein 26
MSKDLSQRAKEIIDTTDYITIASVTKDGLPWNSPVFGAYDKAYNFYWGTHKASQKAQNIRGNRNVFLVIYDSTVPPGTGEGVYVKATAEELTDLEDIKRAHQILQDRRPTLYWNLEELHGDAPIRLFKATPGRIWMNDDGEENGHYTDIRTEVNL